MSNDATTAIFDGAGKSSRVTGLPLPAHLDDGEVLARLALGTICVSDLHTIQGRRREPTPCVLAHEGAGKVAAVGRGREVGLGRRVI